MTSAISALTKIHRERAIPGSEMPLVGVTSNTAPWELLRAAGLQPVLLSPRRKVTLRADRYIEDAFSARMKAVFDFLISAESAVLSAVVIPRTSEQEHKLFIYVREVVRQGVERAPEAILYNLLHARSAEAEVYGLARTEELKCSLERLTGRPVEPAALSNAIAEGNAARRAIRALLEHRENDAPKLGGSEALALIGAWYFMDRSEYARVAQEALLEIRTRPPLKGPRLLIKGPAPGDPGVCETIESAGAIVVAEDDWCGSRAAGRDIDVTLEPIRAIFEKYYFDAPSPRVFPAAIADSWFCRTASEVDGVVFHLPQEDDVMGWDYPRLRSFLDERAIPHLTLRGDSSEEIGAFVERLRNG
jgi:benzoyl-CoA reductase/2-hydroxyglutaryl-CoA dehydratase subunit BcrC/BadD/HgdB